MIYNMCMCVCVCGRRGTWMLDDVGRSAARVFLHRYARGSHKQPAMHPTLITDGSYKSHSGTGLWARPRDIKGQKEKET